MIDAPPTLPPRDCAVMQSLAAADEIGLMPTDALGEARWSHLSKLKLVNVFLAKSWLDGETKMFVEITDDGMAVALTMRCR